jgi:hypothetical protein
VVIDGLELVGQGVDVGDADGELGVVGVGQADAGRFGSQLEAEGIAVQAG